MGMLAKSATKRLVQPMTATVGPWATDAATAYPFLTRHEVLGLAGMRALLGVDQGRSTSSYLGEGKHTSTEYSVSSTHSLLRCEADVGGGTRLSSGAPRPDCTFSSDWSVSYSYRLTEAGQVAVEVPTWRTREDAVVNADLLVAARDAVLATLGSGVHLYVRDGPPISDGIVEEATTPSRGFLDDDKSPFSHDHLDRLSDDYRQPLALPAAAAMSVAAAIDAGYHRPRPATELAVRTADLSGGRSFPAGVVLLRHTDAGSELVIDIPADLPPVERQRSYRAALMCLRDIAWRMKDSDAANSTAIGAHVDRIVQATQQPDRHTTGWEVNWSRTVAAPVVPVAAGRWYPIGLRVLTPTSTNFFTAAVNAQEWVGLRKRTFSSGMRQKTRDANRVYTARRPALLVNEKNERLGYLRYVSHVNVQDGDSTTASNKVAWFWEAKARRIAAAEGVEPGGLLLVTGWSHADGIFGYGEELLALMQAFSDTICAADPKASVQTLYLGT